MLGPERLLVDRKRARGERDGRVELSFAIKHYDTLAETLGLLQLRGLRWRCFRSSAHCVDAVSQDDDEAKQCACPAQEHRRSSRSVRSFRQAAHHRYLIRPICCFVSRRAGGCDGASFDPSRAPEPWSITVL